MKDMLSTLINSGTISISDIASVLYENKEAEQMKTTVQTIPKIGYRSDRNEYYITVPKQLSKSGKRYPIYGKTEEEVIENYKLEVSLHNQGVSVGEKTIIPTLNIMLDYTFKNIFYHSLKESSYLTYEGLCKNHIRNQSFAFKLVDDISSTELLKYFSSSEITNLNGVSVGLLKTILKRTFHQAMTFKYITINPMESVAVNNRRYKAPKKGKQRLTNNEVNKLSEIVSTLAPVIPKYRFTPMFMFMIQTGLRSGEAMAVKYSDINFQRKCLSLQRQMEYLPKRDRNLKKIKFEMQEKSPKYNSVRDIPLSKQAIYWLKFMIALNEKNGFLSDYIFLNKSGKIPSKASVNDVWHKILEEAEIPYCTPHKTRKTFTTAALDSGNLSLPDVSAILGHKDKRMALNTYFTTLNDNTFDESVPSKLDNIFDNTLTTGTAANELRKLL